VLGTCSIRRRLQLSYLKTKFFFSTRHRADVPLRDPLGVLPPSGVPPSRSASSERRDSALSLRWEKLLPPVQINHGEETVVRLGLLCWIRGGKLIDICLTKDGSSLVS
jgi:hypothetical protein